MYKILKYWLYATITFGIVSALVFLAQQGSHSTAQTGNAMLDHVEIKRGSQWLSYEVLGECK